MKRAKRLSLAVFLLLLLGISWLLALTQKSGKAMQQELLKQVDAYLEDEVYVLAVPLLQEALQYDTSENEQVEQTLKSVCLKLMDQSEYRDLYEDLLEKEMAKEYAAEDVYLEAANYYLADGSLKKALAILCNGIEKTKSSTLAELYENRRYVCRAGGNVYENVTAAYNQAAAVEQNGLWGLASAKGALLLPCRYDKISNYLGDRVIVEKDGVISAVDMNGNRLALLHEKAASFACTGVEAVILQMEDGYHMASMDFKTILPEAYEELRMVYDGYAAAKKDGKWGLVNTAGEWLLKPEHDAVLVDELGIAYSQNAFFVKDGSEVTLWKNRDGNVEKLAGVYEDAHPFRDGYAAVKQNGKWGFVDSEGSLVIDYQFEDALSYGMHLAAVQVDGSWGYVDVKGRIVIPCEYEDAKSFRQGAAAVKIDGSWIYLILEEYA